MTIYACSHHRCPGQQGKEEGHTGAEAEQSALCPRQTGSREAGQSGAHGPVMAEQGTVGGHPYTDRYRTHTVLILTDTHT